MSVYEIPVAKKGSLMLDKMKIQVVLDDGQIVEIPIKEICSCKCFSGDGKILRGYCISYRKSSRYYKLFDSVLGQNKEFKSIKLFECERELKPYCGFTFNNLVKAYFIYFAN